jgi:hypothetical protein
MIKHLGFIANTPKSGVQACLDALYCAEKLGASLDKFTLIYPKAIANITYGISALSEQDLALLHTQGINIEQLIKACSGRFHYADCVAVNEQAINWCSMGILGVSIQGVDFHHILSKAISEGEEVDRTMAAYSLNNICQTNNKLATPVTDQHDIRSSLKTLVYANSDQLFTFLISELTKKKNRLVFSAVDTLTHHFISPSDPSHPGSDHKIISAVGEKSLNPDFFFDYRCKTFTKRFAISQSTPLAQGVYVKDKHLINLKKTSNRCEIELIENVNLPLVESLKDLGLQDTELIETEDSYQNETTSFWHGNLINIGQLTQFVSLAASVPVNVNLMILDHWIDNIPSTSTMAIVRKLAQQQFSQFAENLSCFALMPLFVDDENNQIFIDILAQKQTNMVSTMRNRYKLFGKAGVEYFSDFNPIPRHLWTNLMLSLDIWPQQFDIVTATIPDSYQVIKKLATKINQASKKLPSNV